MIKWKRPSGTFIETNEKQETIEYAESLGWKREGAEEKPKRKRRSKAEMEADKEALNDGKRGQSSKGNTSKDSGARL